MLNLHKSHNALMIEPFQTHSRWNATSLSGPHLQNVSYLHLQDPWLMWTPLTNQWWLRVHCSRTQGHREHPCDIWIQRIEPNLLNYSVLNWISGSVAKGNLRLHWRCAGHDLAFLYSWILLLWWWCEWNLLLICLKNNAEDAKSKIHDTSQQSNPVSTSFLQEHYWAKLSMLHLWLECLAEGVWNSTQRETSHASGLRFRWPRRLEGSFHELRGDQHGLQWRSRYKSYRVFCASPCRVHSFFHVFPGFRHRFEDKTSHIWMQKHGTLRLSVVFPPDHPGPVQNVQVPTKCGRQGVPGWTSMKSKFGMTKSNRAALPCLQAPPTGTQYWVSCAEFGWTLASIGSRLSCSR